MTYEVIVNLIKLRFYIVRIIRNFHPNLFINECARKKKSRIPESRCPGVLGSQSFLERYRRTNVLKKHMQGD